MWISRINSTPPSACPLKASCGYTCSRPSAVLTCSEWVQCKAVRVPRNEPKSLLQMVTWRVVNHLNVTQNQTNYQSFQPRRETQGRLNPFSKCLIYLTCYFTWPKSWIVFSDEFLSIFYTHAIVFLCVRMDESLFSAFHPAESVSFVTGCLP